LRKRIVPASVDDEDVELIVCRRQFLGDLLHAHGLRSNIRALPDVGAYRHDIVDRIVLQAVPGIVDHRYRLAASLFDPDRKSVHFAVQRREIEISGLHHLEAKVLEARGHQARIVGRVLELGQRSVTGIADHQRQARG
jgi:hypothetical protein